MHQWIGAHWKCFEDMLSGAVLVNGVGGLRTKIAVENSKIESADMVLTVYASEAHSIPGWLGGIVSQVLHVSCLRLTASAIDHVESLINQSVQAAGTYPYSHSYSYVIQYRARMLSRIAQKAWLC
jgi:hypothetical protein